MMRLDPRLGRSPRLDPLDYHARRSLCQTARVCYTSVSTAPPPRRGQVEFVIPMGGDTMCDSMLGIQVGQKVPDFALATYLPTQKDFGEFKLSENMQAGKWTVLFFYPADFTFV